METTENIVYSSVEVNQGVEAVTRQVIGDLEREVQGSLLDLMVKYDNKFSPAIIVEFDDIGGPTISSVNVFDLDLHKLLENKQYMKKLKKDMNGMNDYHEPKYEEVLKHVARVMFESGGNGSPFTYKIWDDIHLASYYFEKENLTNRGHERMCCVLTKYNNKWPDVFEAEPYLIETMNEFKKIL